MKHFISRLRDWFAWFDEKTSQVTPWSSFISGCLLGAMAACMIIFSVCMLKPKKVFSYETERNGKLVRVVNYELRDEYHWLKQQQRERREREAKEWNEGRGDLIHEVIEGYTPGHVNQEQP